MYQECRKDILMGGSKKFCQSGGGGGGGGGSNFDIFLVDKGREDLNTTKSGPRSAASETPFKWRFAGVPMMAQY